MAHSCPKPPGSRPSLTRPGWTWAWLLAASLLLGACATPLTTSQPSRPLPPPKVAVDPGVNATERLAEPAGPPSPAEPAPPLVATEPEPDPSTVSWADTPKAYRRDGAQHLYRLNEHRVFRGRLPPLLRAVGVMQLELDARGRIQHLRWMRAPEHAPEVIAEIERTVRQAEPFPAPRRLGGVVYTETWLWDKSGRFQLDTLTEGQRSRL